jgi:predicted secreted protein
MTEIVEVSEKQNGQQIEMKLRQTLRVTLPEVRTPGFRWSLRTSGERVLSPAVDDLDSASGATGATGGVAQLHRDFRAEAAGATELVFEYDRGCVRPQPHAPLRFGPRQGKLPGREAQSV